MLKIWGKTILFDLHFLSQFFSHLKQCEISKERFFGPLYYEILPYTYRVLYGRSKRRAKGKRLYSIRKHLYLIDVSLGSRSPTLDNRVF